jgi:hypothetical protein
VFVDALVPSDQPTTRTAEPSFRALLDELADEEGMLPPWTGWWPDASPLFPDAQARAAVEAEQPRLPVAYFDAEVPTPAGWRSLPAAYLGFGDAYAEEQAEARRRGWPLETMHGLHLHQLVDPAGVTDALLRLEAALPAGG